MKPYTNPSKINYIKEKRISSVTRHNNKYSMSVFEQFELINQSYNINSKTLEYSTNEVLKDLYNDLENKLNKLISKDDDLGMDSIRNFTEKFNDYKKALKDDSNFDYNLS